MVEIESVDGDLMAQERFEMEVAKDIMDPKISMRSAPKRRSTVVEKVAKM